MQNSLCEATRSKNTIRENCGYTLKFAPDLMEAGRIYFSPIENAIIDTL